MKRLLIGGLLALFGHAAYAADTTPYMSGTGGLTNGNMVTSGATAGQLTDGGVAPAALATKASPTFTGTQTMTTVVGGGRIVSGTTDGPTAADCGGTIHFTSGSGVTVTMPNNITTLQCSIVFLQEGAGQITFAAGSGAAIHNFHSFTKTAGQWAAVSIILNTNAGGTSAVYTLAGDGA